MIKIEVKSSEISTKSGVSARSGKPYTIRDQDAWAHVTDKNGQPQPYPVKIKLTLADEQMPYAPGVYTLSPASFWVDRFGGLSISPVLAEVKAPQVATKAA